MATVGCDPRIFSRHGCMHARCNRFLAIIKMAKPSNISRLRNRQKCLSLMSKILVLWVYLIFGVVRNLNSPHSIHIFKILHQLISRCCHHRSRSLEICPMAPMKLLYVKKRQKLYLVILTVCRENIST